MQSRLVLALEAAGSRGVFSAYFQLAGAPDQTIGHPGLVRGIVVRDRGWCEVEGIAVGNAITGIDLAGRDEDGE